MKIKVLLISALAMVFAGVAIMIWAVGMGAYPVILIGKDAEKDYESIKRISGEIDISEFDTLTVDSATTEIHIQKGDGYKLEYYTNEKAIPEVSSDGKHLTVRQPKSKLSDYEIGNQFFEVNFNDQTASYKITVPKDSAPIQVDIKSATDKVFVDGVDINGTVESGTDDVEISNVVSSDLEVRTSTDGIHISNSEFDKLSLDASAHSIEVNDCTINDLDANSKSDSITLSKVKLNNANIEALDTIDISVVGKNDYTLDLETASFDDIDVDGTTTEGKFKSEKESGKLIKAKSISGDINISFAGE